MGRVPAVPADATVLHPAAANRQANFFPPETAGDKTVMPENPSVINAKPIPRPKYLKPNLSVAAFGATADRYNVPIQISNLESIEVCLFSHSKIANGKECRSYLLYEVFSTCLNYLR